MTQAEAGESESRVLVGWYWAVLPLGFFVLSLEPAILFMFSLPVGAILGAVNTTRVSPRGVRPMLGALFSSVSIPWSRVEVFRLKPAFPGPVVMVRVGGPGFQRLYGFHRLSTSRTIELLIETVPLEVMRDAGVEIPRGWDGPHVERLRGTLGDSLRLT